MGTPLVIRFKERQDSRIAKKETENQEASDEELPQKKETYEHRTKKKEVK